MLYQKKRKKELPLWNWHCLLGGTGWRVLKCRLKCGLNLEALCPPTQVAGSQFKIPVHPKAPPREVKLFGWCFIPIPSTQKSEKGGCWYYVHASSTWGAVMIWSKARKRGHDLTNPWAKKIKKALMGEEEMKLKNTLPRAYTGEKSYVPESLRGELLKHRHGSKLAGHFRFVKMLHLTQRQFWWPSMRKDISQYVASCPTYLTG